MLRSAVVFLSKSEVGNTLDFLIRFDREFRISFSRRRGMSLGALQVWEIFVENFVCL